MRCLAVLLAVTLLCGCVTQHARPIIVQPFPGPVLNVPANTEKITTPGSSLPSPNASVPTILRPAPAQPARQLVDGSRMPAVQGLLATAERDRRAGKLEAASISLERAQRLAPQSVLVYQRLAAIRLQQKRAAEAEQFARKGMGFATAPAAQAALWYLIAEASRQQGRSSAAQAATARAVELEAITAE